MIGRLLADAGALPDGKLEAIKENCKRNSKPFEYAFLLDALKYEQAQGITIDTARCFFQTDRRDYIIIDAPGHIEFLKNMVTGASRAEAALLVIDASHGVEENTRRHGYFLSMLGIRQVSVLVNKMDLVDYKEEVFESIRDEYKKFLKKIDINPITFIPVSGMEGDNIAIRSRKCPGTRQYRAGTDGCLPCHSGTGKYGFPVCRYRGYINLQKAMTADGSLQKVVDAGKVKAGDTITFYPSGKKTKVKTLEVFNAEFPKYFSAGQAAGFTMTEEIFVKRGEIACLTEETAPNVGVRMKVNLFWLGKENLKLDKTYFLKCGTAKVEMRLESVERVVNASDLSCLDASVCEKNEVAECILKLDRPIAFDLAGTIEATSRFSDCG